MTITKTNILQAAAGVGVAAIAAFAWGAFAMDWNSEVNASTLLLDIQADPSSGDAPVNNASIKATVSGGGSGEITYRFDCTSNGSWDHTFTTVSETYTAVDLCDYPNPGTYQATVDAERGNLSAQGGTGILVHEGDNLFLEPEAIPSSGFEPLNNVDLKATVTGSETGPVTYRFDCLGNGSWDHTFTTVSETYTAVDLCDYPEAGSYRATIEAERGRIAVQGGAGILVKEKDDPATLDVDLTAIPSEGEAPLNNVDLDTVVSGTATGSIEYRFDCTNNGTWDHTVTTTDETYTAVNLCDYPNPGEYIAKVRVERDGMTATDTDKVTVTEKEETTMRLVGKPIPSSGRAPLLDVDIQATVSGSTAGNITYRFDCTNNGTWERIQTTSSTTYTAQNLCDYHNPGTYTVKVQAERGGKTITGTMRVIVGDIASLAVDFSSNPSSGKAPLRNVDLVTFVSGTATGSVEYKFDCTNDGVWDWTTTSSSSSMTAHSLCDYDTPGDYRAKVKVTRGNISIEGITRVLVFHNN